MLTPGYSRSKDIGWEQQIHSYLLGGNLIRFIETSLENSIKV